MSDILSSQLFTTMAQATTDDELHDLLWQHYRLRGQWTALNSERDENRLLQTPDGRRYVFKLTHPAEDRAVTDFQSGALLHAIARDPTLPIPQLVPRQDGQPYAAVTMRDGSQRVLRLLTYLDGQPLHQAVRSSAQRHHLGQTLARLDRALADYHHPAAGHRLLWDIQHTDALRPLLDATPAGPMHPLLADWLDYFAEVLRPTLAGLRRQVIHNDLNPYNVLVDPADPCTTVGIIDFGDMVAAPLVNELAVACSYQLSGHDNPLETAGELIVGYHRLNPLQAAEIELLYDLILSRLCMTVTITGWRAERYPENRQYILRNHGISRDGMLRLLALPREQAVAYLRHLCA